MARKTILPVWDFVASVIRRSRSTLLRPSGLGQEPCRPHSSQRKMGAGLKGVSPRSQRPLNTIRTKTNCETQIPCHMHPQSHPATQ
jgi:hypothetical protein